EASSVHPSGSGCFINTVEQMAKLLFVREAAVVGRVWSRTMIRPGSVILAIEVGSEGDLRSGRELKNPSAVGRELLKAAAQLRTSVRRKAGNQRIEANRRVGVGIQD